MTNGHIAMATILVQQCSRRLKIKRVVLFSVKDKPGIPHPLTG
jgi:hypothetical protein